MLSTRNFADEITNDLILDFFFYNVVLNSDECVKMTKKRTKEKKTVKWKKKEAKNRRYIVSLFI